MSDHLNTPLAIISKHNWQHKEFDKRVEEVRKAGLGSIHINYDLLFDLRKQKDPEYWFRIIEWKGWRIFIPNVNSLSLRSETEADYAELEPEVSEEALADFIIAFIS